MEGQVPEVLQMEEQVLVQAVQDQVTIVEVQVVVVAVTQDQIQDQVQVVPSYHTQLHKVLQMVLFQSPDVMLEEDTTLEDTGISQSTMKTEMQ